MGGIVRRPAIGRVSGLLPGPFSSGLPPPTAPTAGRTRHRGRSAPRQGCAGRHRRRADGLGRVAWSRSSPRDRDRPASAIGWRPGATVGASSLPLQDAAPYLPGASLQAPYSGDVCRIARQVVSRRRRASLPMQARPASISAQLEGSGTGTAARQSMPLSARSSASV